MLATALFAGCATDSKLDTAALEAELLAQPLAGERGALTAVRCPELADPEPGMTLTCRGELGEQQRIEIMVALGGTVDDLTTVASIDERLVSAREVAEVLTRTFSNEIGLVTEVDCGHPVAAVPVDGILECRAVDPAGVNRFFDVRVGPDGGLDLTLR